MNVRYGRPECNIFFGLLDSVCISTIIDRITKKKLRYKPESLTEWITQASNFKTTAKVKLYLCLT